MGSYINFKNVSNTSGAFPLTRQSSIYSLTFDELQDTLGGSGKDFGSMNIDELLKNIWTAEETQAMPSSTGGAQGNLQREASLTLPRTLSQKTVDEVWKDLLGEGGSGGASNLQQRQQSLREITLEEFLVRSGVVREEDTQPIGKPSNGRLYGEIPEPSNKNTDFTLGFQQQSVQNNEILGNQTNKNKSLVGGIGLTDSPFAFVEGDILPSGPKGMDGLGSGNSTVEEGSPVDNLFSDITAKSSVNTSSLSPFQYMFTECQRGRKASAPLEKVQERRHKRMIKNRESAARSRARRQAYTFELEAELEKLKEINRELKQKQAEIMEKQNHQILETEKMPWGSKRKRLRRTLTPPW